MGVASFLRGIFRAGTVRFPVNVENPSRADVEPLNDPYAPEWDEPNLADRSVDDLALQHPAVLTCISQISDDIASIIVDDLGVQNSQGQLRVGDEIAQQRLRVLRRSLDGRETPARASYQAAVADMLRYGDAVLIPRLSPGPSISRQRLLGVDRLLPGFTWDQHRDLFRGRTQINGPMEPFRPNQVCHLRWGPPRSSGHRLSVSPLDMLGQAVRIALAADRDIVKQLRRGMTPMVNAAPRGPNVPTGGGPSKDEKIDPRLKSASLQVRSGAPMIWEQEMNVQTAQHGYYDASVDALRHWQLKEVARVFRVPLPNAGEQVNVGSGVVRALMVQYWNSCIRPNMQKVLDPLSLRLLPPGDRFHVSRFALVRGDIAGMAALINALMPNTGRPAIGTLHEVRDLIGFTVASDEMLEELRGPDEQPDAPGDAVPPVTLPVDNEQSTPESESNADPQQVAALLRTLEPVW